jgi:type II secretory pathway pseudopilin PulG
MKEDRMKNIFQRRSSGYSLVGLMVAVAIAGVVALGAAYVMVSSQNTANMSTLQNEIDRLQYLNLQLSRNPAFVLKQPGFEKTGLLYQCLQHSPPAGSNCVQAPTPKAYVAPTPQNAPGLQKNISSTIQFSPHCPNALSCDAINIKTTTGLTATSQSGSHIFSQTPNFQTRVANTVIPSYVLVPRLGFNFNCVKKTGLITGLNYDSSQAECTPLSGTLSTTTSPLRIFGPLVPTTTQTMTNTDCGSNGFAAIGNFQGQTSCMVLSSGTPSPSPTPTTVAPGPTPPTPPPPPATPHLVCVGNAYLPCFVAGTPVTMADGSRKKIEDVKIGDQVKTFDEFTGKMTVSPVIDIFHHPHRRNQLYTFTLADGTSVTSNDIHLFYVPDENTYLSAQEIFNFYMQGISVRLLNKKGRLIPIRSIKAAQRDVPLYNLHVQSPYDSDTHTSQFGHNYFAGGVLVHNLKKDAGDGNRGTEMQYTCSTDAAGNYILTESCSFYPGYTICSDPTFPSAAGSRDACEKQTCLYELAIDLYGGGHTTPVSSNPSSVTTSATACQRACTGNWSLQTPHWWNR